MKTKTVIIPIMLDEIHWYPISEEEAEVTKVILGDLDITDYIQKNGSMEAITDHIGRNCDVKCAYLSARQEKIIDMNEQYQKEVA